MKDRELRIIPMGDFPLLDADELDRRLEVLGEAYEVFVRKEAERRRRERQESKEPAKTPLLDLMLHSEEDDDA